MVFTDLDNDLIDIAGTHTTMRYIIMLKAYYRRAWQAGMIWLLIIFFKECDLVGKILDADRNPILSGVRNLVNTCIIMCFTKNLLYRD